MRRRLPSFGNKPLRDVDIDGVAGLRDDVKARFDGGCSDAGRHDGSGESAVDFTHVAYGFRREFTYIMLIIKQAGSRTDKQR